MKINKISITAFRSIQSATIEAGPFNVFVGQNNHGKTNLFEAVEWFYTGKGEVDKIRFGRAGEAEIAVEIEFGDIKDGLAKMRNERNRASIEKVIGEQDSVRIRRSSIDPKNRKIYSEAQGGWLEKNPAGFDAALNDFLPKLEYVSTAINPMDYAKYGKNTPISNMLSGVLTAILEQNKEYQEFRAKFDELFSAPTSALLM
jgi:putative ATP-dependent endonuclease of OLD family